MDIYRNTGALGAVCILGYLHTHVDKAWVFFYVKKGDLYEAAVYFRRVTNQSYNHAHVS